MDQLTVGQFPSDFDYATDQSIRVARRLAHGVYKLTRDGRDIGEEVWSIFALLNSGYRLMAEIDQKWPMTHEQRVQLDVDEHWNAQGMWVQIDIGNVRRMAACIPADNVLNVELTDQRLNEEDQLRSKWKQRSKAGAVPPARNPPAPSVSAATAGVNKSVAQVQAPFEANTHLDFASALSNYVALQRLKLEQGSQATFNSIVLSLPTLVPINVEQTYSYDPEDAQREDPIKPLGRQYSIVETAPPNLKTTFWTDEHGIVLKQELMLHGARHVCEMVNYRWQA